MNFPQADHNHKNIPY